MLEAIISHMPVVEANSSIGSINYSRDERIRLARESANFVCDVCGPIVNLQKKMINAEPKAPG